MEVFIYNLPEDLSERDFTSQLEPFMQRLSILDYLCDKQNGKTHAHITFLDPHDGEKFLEAHGKEDIPNQYTGKGRPKSKSRLNLMGSHVYCTQSAYDPKDLTLMSLEYIADQRSTGAYKVEDNDPAILFQMLSVSCGYSSFVGDEVAYTPEIHWDCDGSLKFTKQHVIVKFFECIVKIPLVTVVGFVWCEDGFLTLTLSIAPVIFCDTTDPGDESKTTRTRHCAISPRHAKVVGHCLVYQFQVSTIDLLKKIRQLEDWDISVTYYDLALGPPPDLVGQSSSANLKALMELLGPFSSQKLLPFETLFQLQALAYNGYLHPMTVLSLAIELERLSNADRLAGRKPISADAIKKLIPMLDWPFPGVNPNQFEVPALIDVLKANEEEIQKGFAYGKGLTHDNTRTRVNRVMVTPTRVILQGGELEPNNRILRKFPNHHDCFLRVQFCDENGEDIRFNPGVGYGLVFDRFKNLMKNGIQIADSTYFFLGFSHSSLRSHAAWFCCPFIDDNHNWQTHYSIIETIGDLSHITCPARCASRIGQAFSETPFTVPLEEKEVYVSRIPDVKSADGLRVFSDGVGTISHDALQSVRSSVPRSMSEATCLQIRYGGSKGMLALDSRLRGALIQIRPSMTKFESEDIHDLEICDMGAEPIPMFLNRQIIKILEDMGVPDKWFFKLLNEELQYLQSITAVSFAVADFLVQYSVGNPISLHNLYRQATQLGLDYKQDTFLRSVVEATILQQLRMLKYKARIPVRQGITLFGVMDETGFLKEGEVYVTFDTMDGRHRPPPGPGDVLVTRSPALHDGDIQVAQNAIPPDMHPLRRHRNCIVFSQKGKRDLPSQLGGGDLDGDLYNIGWDPEAKPIRTFEPANYPASKPLDIGYEVKTEDMANFFVDFMRTDHLGVIAMKHMTLADQKPEGTSHPSCRKIAGLHSTAVDFSKTGIPARLQDLPKGNNFRPDFMAPGPYTRILKNSKIEFDEFIHCSANDEDENSKRRHIYYKSKKILGKLYRAIDERKIWSEDVNLEPEKNKPPFWEGLIENATVRCAAIGSINWRHQAESAKCIKRAYEDAMISTMKSFSEHPVDPISELEVFIGCLINKTGVQNNRQRNQSVKLRDEFERIATWITKMIRRDHNLRLTGYEQEFDSLELCLACVHVGLREEEDNNTGTGQARREKYSGLSSFRVVAACALLGELDYQEEKMKRWREAECAKIVAVIAEIEAPGSRNG